MNVLINEQNIHPIHKCYFVHCVCTCVRVICIIFFFFHSTQYIYVNISFL